MLLIDQRRYTSRIFLNSSVPRSVERNRIYYTTYNLKSFSALKPKDACFSRYFSISVISSMYFRRTIARPRMAVTHHEPAVLYPVCIRVILAKFLLLNLMRIIINGFSVYFCWLRLFLFFFFCSNVPREFSWLNTTRFNSSI